LKSDALTGDPQSNLIAISLLTQGVYLFSCWKKITVSNVNTKTGIKTKPFITMQKYFSHDHNASINVPIDAFYQTI